jgi:hypothetical protein
MRQNQGKPKLSNVLHMPGALEALAAVLEHGAEKYGPVSDRDWMEYDPNEVRDSLMRHATADTQSELDESRLPHVAHMLFNCAVLCDHYLKAHGPGSFWRLLHEDSSVNLSPPGSAVFDDQRLSRPPSSPSLPASVSVGRRSSSPDSSAD